MAETRVSKWPMLWENTAIRSGLIVWAVLGLIAWVFVMVYFDPLGGKIPLGDPFRQVISWVFVGGFAIPVGLLNLSYASTHPEWIAPRGKYVPGRQYAPLSVRAVITIGVLAAAYTALRFFELAHMDWAAVCCAIASTFFSPFVSFFVIWIGIFTGGILIGSQFTVIQWLSFMTYEGTLWSLISTVWWRLVEPSFGKWRPVRFVIYVILASVIHTTFVYAHWMSTMVWATLWENLFYWLSLIHI